jgi:N-[(2S)-2-amino-2-carboxyethyl]-L-glutamate dehydrogenase
MRDGDVLILNGTEVHRLLAGRELELIETVRRAYETQAQGESSLPHSSFVRFPHDARNRVIALPAYLGGEFGVVGIKWISSFPGNLERGLDRASAVMVLNSTLTGHPSAILEGSVISAKRTAASAALAARTLTQETELSGAMGIIGCGLINFEIARFIRASLSRITKLVVYDRDPQRASLFAAKCGDELGFAVEIVPELDDTLAQPLVSFATSAATPHVHSLSRCAPGTTILHISLRDLAPELILANDNVVDDIDHICRAQTSIHLAQQYVGNHDFVRCTLADITSGNASPRKSAGGITIFSPFGLGCLDVAAGQLVFELATREGCGTMLPSFLPKSWADSPAPAF